MCLWLATAVDGSSWAHSISIVGLEGKDMPPYLSVIETRFSASE